MPLAMLLIPTVNADLLKKILKTRTPSPLKDQQRKNWDHNKINRIISELQTNKSGLKMLVSISHNKTHRIPLVRVNKKIQIFFSKALSEYIKAKKRKSWLSNSKKRDRFFWNSAILLTNIWKWIKPTQGKCPTLPSNYFIKLPAFKHMGVRILREIMASFIMTSWKPIMFCPIDSEISPQSINLIEVH